MNWINFKTWAHRAWVNWKTTAPGVVVFLTLFGPQFGWITDAQALKITAVATAFGLIQAKSMGVTGGSVENPSKPENKIR